MWAHNTWCREIFIAHMEMNGKGVPSDAERELHLTTGLKLTTKVVEDTFNWLRMKRLTAKANSMGRMTIWQKSVSGRVLEDSGHTPLGTEPQNEALAPPRVPTSIFDSRKCQFSLGQEALDEWKNGHAASPSPDNFVAASLRTSALAWSGGDPGKLPKLEISGAMPKGIIIAEGDDCFSDDKWRYVLHASSFGVLVWPVDIFRHGEGRRASLRRVDKGASPQQLYIVDLGFWFGYSVSPSLALEADEDNAANVAQARHCLQFEVPDVEAQPILHNCAHSGFKHCDGTVLTRLLQVCDIPAKGLRTQHDKRAALVRIVLKDLLEDMIQHIMDFGSIAEGEYSTVLSAADVALATDILDAAEQEEVQEEVQDSATKATEAVSKRARAASSKARVARPRASPASPTAHSPGGEPAHGEAAPESPGEPDGDLAGASPAELAIAQRGPQEVEARPEGVAWTLAEARLMLPVALGVSLTIASGNRWELRYRSRPAPPHSHSATWGPERSQHDALRQVLEWAWRAHTEECGGEDCPHDFSDWRGSLELCACARARCRCTPHRSQSGDG